MDDAVSKVASMASEAADNVSALPVRKSALNLNLELTPTPADASNDSNTPQTPADIRAKLEFNPVGTSILNLVFIDNSLNIFGHAISDLFLKKS